jgi:hypothetical protein
VSDWFNKNGNDNDYGQAMRKNSFSKVLQLFHHKGNPPKQVLINLDMLHVLCANIEKSSKYNKQKLLENIISTERLFI